MIQTIRCKVTGVVHKILSNNEESIGMFKEWINDLEIRSKKQKIYIVFDCEGWDLGMVKNSLRMIQLCEVADTVFSNHKDRSGISAGIKPGFLIQIPNHPEMIELLNYLFNMNNVYYLSFDFTSDVVSMLDAGISIDFKRLYDSQLTNRFYSNPIEDTKCLSMLKCVQDMCSIVDEATPSSEMVQCLKPYYFALHKYLSRNEKDPYEKMVDQTFYEYAANDLVMTSIAVIRSCTMFNKDKVWEFSRLKSKILQEMINKSKNVLMPSLKRHLCFCEKYSITNIEESQYTLKKPILTDEELIIVLKSYDNLLKIDSLLGTFLYSPIQKLDTKSLIPQYLIQLEKNHSRLIQLNTL